MTHQIRQTFPGGSSGEEPACQRLRHKRYRFDPWVGKIPWKRAWQPTPGESHGERSPAGYLQRITESDTIEATQQAHYNYEAFDPKAEEYTFFSVAHGIFSRIDHMLNHKMSTGKFKKIEIILSIFSNHNSVRLEVNYNKNAKTPTTQTHGGQTVYY